MVNSQPRILILGGDADGNLGDRAILQTMCDQLHGLCPNARLTVVSSQPDRAQADYGAHVVAPGLGGLMGLCKAAAASDLVLCGGGGLFQDDDSLVKMPYWGLRVLLVRLLVRRVVGYALGVGPLQAASSRLFARLAFACMERISVRDVNAERLAQQLTKKTVMLLPDPALLLAPAAAETARTWLAQQGVPLDGRPLIGVAARRWFPAKPRLVPNRVRAKLRWGNPTPQPQAEHLTGLLAKVLDQAVQRHDAYVVFLPTYTLSHEGDDQVCREILGKMATSSGQVLIIKDPRLYKACTGHLSMFLGGRMHPMIFAAAMGTPVVGLAYNQKFQGFFQWLQSDHVIDVATFIEEKRTEDLYTLIETALTERSLDIHSIEVLQQKIQDFNKELLQNWS